MRAGSLAAHGRMSRIVSLVWVVPPRPSRRGFKSQNSFYMFFMDPKSPVTVIRRELSDITHWGIVKF